MGAPNLASARSTISIARSTPAQKPRGSASTISFTDPMPGHPDELDLEGHGLARQRVVEVELHGRVLQADHGARVAARAVRRGELHHVAHAVLLGGIAELGQQTARDPLLHLGIALAEGRARRQLELLVRALGQAEQPLLDGWRQLAGAQRQRRRLAPQRVYYVSP